MFGAIADGTTNDTTAIQNFLNALPYFPSLVFPNRSFNFDCGVTVSGTGKIRFDNPTFKINDTGPDTTLRDGVSKGKVGIYFNACVGLELSGRASLIGQGTVGASTIAVVVFEKCKRLADSSILYCENMAAGRFVMWCDYSVFGDMIAYLMKGFQTFGSPLATAGTADVVVGCRFSKFGNVHSEQNYKPVRYLSTAFDEIGAAYDNEGCSFGFVSGTPATGSAESSLISIRSAHGRHFAGCHGNGFGLGVYIVKYASDTTFRVDKVDIDTIKGEFVQTSASAEAALQTYVESGGIQIGSVSIGSIQAQCAAEYGVLIQSGRITIGSADIDGSQRPFGFTNSTVRIGSAYCGNQEQQAVAIGDGADVSINELGICTGVPTAVTGAVTYSSTFGGSGGKANVHIKKITYGKGGAASDYLYVFYDGTNGFESTQIGDIIGTGTSGAARFASDTFASIRKWLNYSTQPPQPAPVFVARRSTVRPLLLQRRQAGFV